MIAKKEARRKRCKNCNRVLDRIWFTALMTEEWGWNGEGYNECEEVVGTGLDFGFGTGYK